MEQRGLRALVVDPHDIARWGMVQLVASLPEVKSCTEANSLGSVWQVMNRDSIDLIVSEIEFSDGTVIQLLAGLKARGWIGRLLVCSGSVDHDAALRTLAAGAGGYLSKLDSLDEIRSSIREMLKGKVSISSCAAAEPNARPRRQAWLHETAQIQCLSKRERQIFELVATGQDVGEIARTLKIATKTVEAHRQNIRKKMGLRSMSELIGRAAIWKHAGG